MNEFDEKKKVETQSLQLPIPLKIEIDELKIIPRESYPSVIQRIVSEYKILKKKKVK